MSVQKCSPRTIVTGDNFMRLFAVVKQNKC